LLCTKKYTNYTESFQIVRRVLRNIYKYIYICVCICVRNECIITLLIRAGAAVQRGKGATNRTNPDGAKGSLLSWTWTVQRKLNATWRTADDDRFSGRPMCARGDRRDRRCSHGSVVLDLFRTATRILGFTFIGYKSLKNNWFLSFSFF